MNVKIKYLNIILRIKKIITVFCYVILNEIVIKGVIIIIICQNLRVINLADTIYIIIIKRKRYDLCQ